MQSAADDACNRLRFNTKICGNSKKVKKSAYFLDKKSVIEHVWPKLYYKAELSSILVKLNLNSRLTDHCRVQLRLVCNNSSA